jgi:hypothetical protein
MKVLWQLCTYPQHQNFIRLMWMNIKAPPSQTMLSCYVLCSKNTHKNTYTTSTYLHKLHIQRNYFSLDTSFEAFTAVMTQVKVFWVLTLCSVVVEYQHLLCPCCLHLWVKWPEWEKMAWIQAWTGEGWHVALAIGSKEGVPLWNPVTALFRTNLTYTNFQTAPCPYSTSTCTDC